MITILCKEKGLIHNTTLSCTGVKQQYWLCHSNHPIVLLCSMQMMTMRIMMRSMDKHSHWTMCLMTHSIPSFSMPSGLVVSLLCRVRHFPYMCTGYRTTQNSGRVNVWQVKAPVIYILPPKSTIPLYVYYLPKLYLSEFVLQKCWRLVLAPLKLNLSMQCISICYLELL